MSVDNNFLLNFKEDKETNMIYFVGNYMEVLIPSYYFKTRMARIIEDKYETLGIFIIRVYKNEDKKENAITHTYKLPVKITTKPSNSYKDKFTIKGETNEYTVLQYYKNDVFLCSNIMVQKSQMVTDFINFYHSGKLPTFIDYEDSVKLQLECIRLNKSKFPVPGTLFECIASEILRDSSDVSKPYRFTATNSKNKNYKPVSMTELPTFNSTFTSVTFEDIDYQLIASVNKTRYNKKEAVSPLEKTIKY
jgi:hypothetical protein